MRMGSGVGDYVGAIDIYALQARMSKFSPSSLLISFQSGMTGMGYPVGLPIFLGRCTFQIYRNGQLIGTTKDNRTFIQRSPKGTVLEVLPVWDGIAETALPQCLYNAEGAKKIHLSWDPPASGETPTEYRVYWDAGAGAAPSTLLATLPHIAGKESYEYLTGELTSDTYRIEVRSRDAAGNEDTTISDESVVISVRPPPPTNFAYTYDDVAEEVTLTWTKASGATGYNLYWTTHGGAIDYDTGDFVGTVGDVAEWPALSVVTGGVHRYGLRSKNASFEEKNRDVTLAIEFEWDGDSYVDVSAKPNQPEGFQAVAVASGEITLSCYYRDDSEDLAMTHIRFYRDNGPGSGLPTTTVQTVAKASGNPSYYEYGATGLTEGVEYTFLARARDHTGTGLEDRNEAYQRATPDSTPPGPVVDFAAAGVA